MATEKILIFDEAGNAKRMKVRIARFLDNEPVTASDKENIRTTLDVDDSLTGTFTTPLSVTSASDSTFTGGGNVGIGGSSTYPLTVSKTGDNVKVDVTNTVNANFRIGTSGSAVQIGPSTSSSLELQTGGTTRCTIDSSGNVTVNGGQMQVAGGAVSAPSYAFSGDLSTGMSRPTANAINFVTGGTERWRINASGNLVANGTAIDFGSGASTTLDDYEEGTWTPVFAPSGGSFTALTMNVVAARYVKIGHQVTVNCYIQTTNLDTTGASGQVMVTGLPYGNAGSNNFVATHIGYAIDWTEAPAGGYVNQSSTQIVLNKRFASITGSLSPMDVNGLNTASGSKNTIMLTATYNSF